MSLPRKIQKTQNPLEKRTVIQQKKVRGFIDSLKSQICEYLEDLEERLIKTPNPFDNLFYEKDSIGEELVHMARDNVYEIEMMHEYYDEDLDSEEEEELLNIEDQNPDEPSTSYASNKK